MPESSRMPWRDGLLAWAVCLTPRLALFLWAWPNVRLDSSSVQFLNGAIVTDIATPMWPPAYEACAEILWRLVGGHAFGFGLGHLAVHALAGVFVLSVCRSLELSGRARWLAVIATALLPYYVSASTTQVDVGVLVAVAAAFTATMCRWCVERNARASQVLVTACAAMLLFLTRANAVTMIVALYAVVYVRVGPVQRRGVFASAVIFVVMLGIWSAVTLVRFGAFTPFPANVGSNLWVGNHDGVAETLAGRSFNPTDVRGPHARSDPFYDADAVTTRAARNYMRSHPGETVMNAVRKAGRYWDWRLDTLNPHSVSQELAYSMPYLLMLWLGAIGARELWRAHRMALAVLSAVSLGYFAPHVLAYGMIRHRMSVEWATLILAAVGADVLARAASTTYSLRRDD